MTSDTQTEERCRRGLLNADLRGVTAPWYITGRALLRLLDIERERVAAAVAAERERIAVMVESGSECELTRLVDRASMAAFIRNNT